MYEIEQAAFSAWPALEEQDYQGWRLRFSEGYTKRANSANAQLAIDSLSTSQLAQIEQIFQARRLKPIFRLASFCTTPAVDRRLEECGYHFADLSWVMTTRLDQVEMNEAESFPLTAREWLPAFQAMLDHDTREQKIHLRMLEAIKGQCAFAVVREGEQIVCCGLGVMTGSQLGLFDIVTHPDFRGRGLAQQLCSTIMSWGKSNGASHAYLQVAAANSTAIRVYEKLGFSRCYHYWYRVHP